MVANLGYGALLIALLVSLFGIGAAAYGVRKNRPAWVDSARNAMLLTWPLVTLAALSIIYLLVNNHYAVEYVANVTSNSMPLYLKVTASGWSRTSSPPVTEEQPPAPRTPSALPRWDRDREF